MQAFSHIQILWDVHIYTKPESRDKQHAKSAKIGKNRANLIRYAILHKTWKSGQTACKVDQNRQKIEGK